MAFYDESGEYIWRCTGTLLSPMVLLTAGHCTFGTTSTKVRFDSEITDPEYPFADGASGTPYPHPDYDDYWSQFPNTYDVGVVVRTRYTSTSMIVNVRSHLTDGYNLHTSNNPGKGHGTSGGACFGDSGGPIFYPEDSNTVVGIVSFGMNWNCKGADWGYRTDIPTTQDFVNGFLGD